MSWQAFEGLGHGGPEPRGSPRARKAHPLEAAQQRGRRGDWARGRAGASTLIMQLEWPENDPKRLLKRA